MRKSPRRACFRSKKGSITVLGDWSGDLFELMQQLPRSPTKTLKTCGIKRLLQSFSHHFVAKVFTNSSLSQTESLVQAPLDVDGRCLLHRAPKQTGPGESDQGLLARHPPWYITKFSGSAAMDRLSHVEGVVRGASNPRGTTRVTQSIKIQRKT